MKTGKKLFQPGQSGNPNGRPKKTKEEYDLIAACKEKTPQALEVLLTIMESGQNERNQLAAAQAIIERAYGKPKQPIEGAGENGEHILIQKIERIVRDPANRDA